MKKYFYKNISVYMLDNRWCADYIEEDGGRFTLHSGYIRTKECAIEVAKIAVDRLNKEEEANK